MKKDLVPPTHEKAVPCQPKSVVHAMAVRVVRGFVRGSVVEGIFLLADTPQPFAYHEKMLRVEVKCLWFGQKPSDSWMQITLLGYAELLRDYHGEVFTNIQA
jgi:hypothetical protein